MTLKKVKTRNGDFLAFMFRNPRYLSLNNNKSDEIEQKIIKKACNNVL